MINFAIQCDPTGAAITDAISRICAEYGSVGAINDRFTLICGEENASFCQRVLDDKSMRMFRIELIVLPPEMLTRGSWCVTRGGRDGVWSRGAA